MAEDKNDIVLDSMPGADVKTEEETKPFEVDLNFEDEAPAEDAVIRHFDPGKPLQPCAMSGGNHRS